MSDPSDFQSIDDSQEIHSADPSVDDIEAAYLRAMEVTEGLLPEPDFAAEAPEIHQELEVNTAADEVDQTCEDSLELDEPGQQLATSTQVIEALLFVGSSPLPAKKIIEVLGGSTTHEQVDELIEKLNETYQSQYRPYEIGLIEGGYRMTLKSEFEPVRRRVYGQGPKEVKLNQETLEVLALIAYQQPTSRSRLEDLGKKNVGNLVRQLLRRQLIKLEKGDDPEMVSYSTTKRFLELFGLASIDDLPQAMDFNFK